MRSASAKPRVITSAVRSPVRSSSALVATVVPIFTASIAPAGIGAPGAQAEQLADAVHRRVAIALRVLGQQLVRDERAVRPARDDVGERAAAVDPELPACIGRNGQSAVTGKRRGREGRYAREGAHVIIRLRVAALIGFAPPARRDFGCRRQVRSELWYKRRVPATVAIRCRSAA